MVIVIMEKLKIKITHITPPKKNRLASSNNLSTCKPHFFDMVIQFNIIYACTLQYTCDTCMMEYTYNDIHTNAIYHYHVYIRHDKYYAYGTY